MKVISKKMDKFVKIFEEAGGILAEALMSKEERKKLHEENLQKGIEPKKKGEPSNVYHIAPNVKVELMKVYKEEKTIYEIMLEFEPWFNELERLIRGNETNLRGKALSKHVSEVYGICSLFQESHNHAK